jgi:hypothetical protein
MDEQTTALARRLRAEMDRETALFTELGCEVERLKDSFQAKEWAAGLAVADRMQDFSARIEAAEAGREAVFAQLRELLGRPGEAAFSAVLPRLPDGCRAELEQSWRGLRAAVVRVKTASGRLRYSAEALAVTFTRMLEAVFPHRKGRIYSRRGTATAPTGSLLVDRQL